ncbi:hypothetical protein BH23CHL8_BH23CHL8_14110 [soil metagenome]
MTLMLGVSPAMAASPDLDEFASSTYRVDPANRRIDVQIVLRLRNTSAEPLVRTTWGPIYLEDAVSEVDLRITGARRDGSFSDRPGPWKAMDILLPRLNPGQERSVSINYQLDAGALTSALPVRLGGSFVYFCMTGQEVAGVIEVRLPRRYAITDSGSPLEEVGGRVVTGDSTEPGDLFTCVEGIVEQDLSTSEFVGPGDRRIILQAPPEDERWLSPAREFAPPSLDRLAAFLDQDIPGTQPVIIRQSPPASLGGYASDHSTPGVVQLDDFAGVGGIDHQMAHAWFGIDAFPERWMREGLAEWAAVGVAGSPCPAVTDADPSLDLSTWQVVRPTAPANIDAIIEQQEAAACGIMSLLASRMGGDDAFKAVAAAMLAGDAKYAGPGPSGVTPVEVIDWMEFLDAVDEVGLVPAVGTTELDFAQDLLARYGIPHDPSLLEQRSQARQRYHAFLNNPAGLAAPAVVRRAMDEWRFSAANEAMDRADAVLADLASADTLFPEAGLVPFIKPDFENAGSLLALDEVRAEAASLRDDAERVIPLLNELRQVAPEAWSLPAAVVNAVTQKRFDDASAAIEPAVTVAQAIMEADEALPEAGLLDRFGARFEAATTAVALESLAVEATEVSAQAQQVGVALAGLRASVGDWVIPEAVTAPIEEGRILEALAVVQDARGVVIAAREADQALQALPEAHLAAGIRPRFEAATSALEMAALRADAESDRDNARTVGVSLDSLQATVPTWALPAILTRPIAEGDFDLAARLLSQAAAWVRFADEADAALPEMDALDRTREAFEGATASAELESGADLAEDWALAATRVGDALAQVSGPTDLMTDIGLYGTDLEPLREAAIAAARSGDVALATDRAVILVSTYSDGTRGGGLRLAGLAFVVVAIVGLVGLWWLFRRNQGPPWARQGRPPWAREPSKSPLKRKPRTR